MSFHYADQVVDECTTNLSESILRSEQSDRSPSWMPRLGLEIRFRTLPVPSTWVLVKTIFRPPKTVFILIFLSAAVPSNSTSGAFRLQKQFGRHCVQSLVFAFSSLPTQGPT